MIPNKITSKIDNLHDLLEEIKYELDCITADYDDLEADEKKQVPHDLRSIEEHLRRTAKRFSHLLKPASIPEWAYPTEEE